MSFFKAFITALALANSATALVPAGQIQRRGVNSAVERAWWHSATETSANATADGSVGVFFEPDLEPGKTGKDGATVQKIAVGTYTIPPATTKEISVPRFQKPCSNCYITAFQLGLEYPDGKIANVDTGAWCHHIDLIIPGQQDYTCPSSLLNTLTTFSDPAMGGERIFSGGNERVPVRLNSKSKYGIWLSSSSYFGGVLELMNERKSQPITVVMTMTFETVSGFQALSYKPAQLIWLDVTNCGRMSDFPAKPGKYELSSKDFTMTKDGEWLTGIGHEHDGGTLVEMYQNGKLVCSSKQIYGNRRGGYNEPNDGTIAPVYMMGENAHISDVAVCKDFATVSKGDRVSMKAYYDDSQHMQMRKPTGGLDMQMGIMFSYIGWH